MNNKTDNILEEKDKKCPDCGRSHEQCICNLG